LTISPKGLDSKNWMMAQLKQKVQISILTLLHTAIEMIAHSNQQ